MHSHVHHTHASRTCFSAIIQLFFYMKLFLLQQGALTTDVADDFPHLFAAANLSILTVFAQQSPVINYQSKRNRMGFRCVDSRSFDFSNDDDDDEEMKFTESTQCIQCI